MDVDGQYYRTVINTMGSIVTADDMVWVCTFLRPALVIMANIAVVSLNDILFLDEGSQYVRFRPSFRSRIICLSRRECL